MPRKVRASNLPEVRINPLNLLKIIAGGNREYIVRIDDLHKRRGYLVVVIVGVREMHTRRTDITYRQCHTPCELSLNIEVPLHFIAARGIRFNARGLQRARAE